LIYADIQHFSRTPPRRIVPLCAELKGKIMNKKQFISVFTFMLCIAPLPAFAAKTPKVYSISCDELRQTMQTSTNTIVVDVRSAAEYQTSHIEGALSRPLDAIPTASWPKTADIVLYCSGVGCPLSKTAAIELLRAGYISARTLKGGLNDWESKGYPMVKSKRSSVCSPVQPGALYKLLQNNSQELVLLDTRPLAEYEAGHIPGAKLVPLEDAAKAAVPGKTMIVIDRQPARMQKACEAVLDANLQANSLSGGMAVWSALKYPLSTGRGDGK